ncbi:hypothetical protein X753_19870 [Mesorhizobium sp. LNJC399B00]|nr:hypothetical protein X753_19870 [Mesorhizobium sp. LNJC399B00]
MKFMRAPILLVIIAFFAPNVANGDNVAVTALQMLGW